MLERTIRSAKRYDAERLDIVANQNSSQNNKYTLVYEVKLKTIDGRYH